MILHLKEHVLFSDNTYKIYIMIIIILTGISMNETHTTSLPFSFTVNNHKDILTIERIIRQLSLCDGTYCAFLQSAEYLQLKFILQQSIYHKEVIQCQKIWRIPKTKAVICLLDNHKTVVFRDDAHHVYADEIDTLHEPIQDEGCDESDQPKKKKIKTSGQIINELILNSRKRTIE